MRVARAAGSVIDIGPNAVLLCSRMMKPRPLRCLLLLMLLSGTSLSGRDPGNPQAVPAADLLERILEKTEVYCRRLGKVSLHFVCRERIEERQFDPPRQISGVSGPASLRRVTSVSLEYDYQLIWKGESIESYRFFVVDTEVRY